MPENFFLNELYKSVFPKKVKPFLINNLKTIGLPDPFPTEDKSVRSRDTLPKKDSDGNYLYVYKASRYFEETCPLCLYIPNRDIMFKFMRACIKVEDPMEMWCFSDDEVDAMNIAKF